MNKKIWLNYSVKDLLVAIIPVIFIILMGLYVSIQHLDPAPPSHLTLSTGDDQSDLQDYAKQYQEILKQDGVILEIRSSQGGLAP